MRIDAVGLPIDRLQLRPESMRPAIGVRVPAFVLPAAAAKSPQTYTDAVRPLRSAVDLQSASAAARVATTAASAGASGRQPAAGDLVDQLRRQRLSLGRMLTDLNRQMTELVSPPAD